MKSIFKKSKTKLFFTLICYANFVYAQTTQDSVNYPYWIRMMSDKSANFYKTLRAFDLYFSNKEKLRGTGYKHFERWSERRYNEIYRDGSFRPTGHVMNELQEFNRKVMSSRSGNPKWKSLGPFNSPEPTSEGIPYGVGRVNAINFHPTDTNILYCGTPSSGFWYSLNYGKNWNSTNTDAIPQFGVSSIAVIPQSNSHPIILIGTGDKNAGDVDGLGVYSSKDGGLNFQPSNTGMGNYTVSQFALNYKNSSVLFASTEKGIFKSNNKGESWVRVSDTQFFMDIVYHPTDTNYIYAATHDSLYRSTDGGLSWTSVKSGLKLSNIERMAIAVTNSQPDIVYLITVKENGFCMDGFYKSSNRGSSFELQLTGNNFNPLGYEIDGSDLTNCQGWFDLAIHASPSDSNIVYVGGINIFRSTDGGKSFKCKSNFPMDPTIPSVHADIHCITRNPVNNKLWIASDGGIDLVSDEGLPIPGSNDANYPIYIVKNNGLVISQLYNLGVNQTIQPKFIIGTQDNTTMTGSVVNNTWKSHAGGDGMHCELNNFNSNVMHGSIQYGNLIRTTDGGIIWDFIGTSISEEGAWVTPYHLHPRVNNVLVAIYNNVWISRNASGSSSPTFTRISNGINKKGSALRFSNTNNNYVFCGWRDGTLRYSGNILASNPSFVLMNSPSIDTIRISDIETSFTDVNTLYVTKGNKVYKTNNLGASWTDISENLPDIGLNCIVIDKTSKEGLYVGSDAGIYYRDNSMPTWVMYSDSLSLNSSVTDLEIVYDTVCPLESKIFAATYGRGLWVNTLYDKSAKTFTLSTDKSNVVCLGDKVNVSASGSDTYTYDASLDIVKKSANSFTITPTISGQYKFYGKKTDGSCESKVLDIKVNPLPIINITPNSKTINKGEIVNLMASGAKTYSWSPNIFIQSGTNAEFLEVKPDSTITYTLVGKDSNGCSSTLKVTITVNGSSLISHSEQKRILIYPNPTSDHLNIISDKELKFIITDINGKVLITEKNQKNIHRLSVEKFNKGFYFIDLYIDAKLVDSYKITIE